jgi:hypothetical protein
MKSMTRVGAVAAFVLAMVGDPLQAAAVCVALWMFERVEARR